MSIAVDFFFIHSLLYFTIILLHKKNLTFLFKIPFRIVCQKVQIEIENYTKVYIVRIYKRTSLM